MSKGPPTEPRAPKLRLSEGAVVPLKALGALFAPVWVPLGRLPSALVALLTSERVSSGSLGRLWASPGPLQRPKCTISCNRNNDFAMLTLRTKVSPRAAYGALLGPFGAPVAPPGGPPGSLEVPWVPFSRDTLWVNAILELHFSVL